jgi:RHS repeat-associated protein
MGQSAAARGKHFYAKDHLGSIRDVLDQAGNTVVSYDYDPYGELTNTPPTVPEFGYAGMQYHAGSGLYLTLYRAYDPQTGRWLSRDPIGEAGGINLYGYVEGNPVAWVDPTGEFLSSPELVRLVFIAIGIINVYIDNTMGPPPNVPRTPATTPGVPGWGLPDPSKNPAPVNSPRTPVVQKPPSTPGPRPIPPVPAVNPGICWWRVLGGVTAALYSSRTGGKCVNGCCEDEQNCRPSAQ